jgi:hypothetical protein
MYVSEDQENRSIQKREHVARIPCNASDREADDHDRGGRRSRKSCDCSRQGGRRSRKSCDCSRKRVRRSRRSCDCSCTGRPTITQVVRLFMYREADDHASRATVHVQGGRRSRKSCDCSCTGSPTITQVAFLLVIVGLPPRSIVAESSSGSLEAGSRSHRSDPKRRGKWSRPTRSTATSMCGTG